MINKDVLKGWKGNENRRFYEVPDFHRKRTNYIFVRNQDFITKRIISGMSKNEP